MKTVTITITPDGESTVDLNGFHGKGCGRVLDDFAGEITRSVRQKREYAEPERQKEQAKS